MKSKQLSAIYRDVVTVLKNILETYITNFEIAMK